MHNLETIDEEYRSYVDWLLKTKFKSLIPDATCNIPDSCTVILDWSKEPFEIRLDLRLKKKEGWLYICNKSMKTDCLVVYNLSRDADLERMLGSLKDYLK